MDLNIQDLKKQGLLLFECISGSRAYGTSLPTSDTDIKGVFVLPQDRFFGLDYIGQVSSEKNDEVYYELRRFAELLHKNNPGILEMLASPDDCVLFCHPLFEAFRRESFLSKLCKDSFAGFAYTQVKRARGLNKKINQPMVQERKTPFDFCYVTEKQGSMPVRQWLAERGWLPERCGLAAVPNMRDVYALFYDLAGDAGFSGIIQKENANDVALSSIPKGWDPVGIMAFNKDAYAIHCREYREYQDWLNNRNEERYQNTLVHGKNYDAKNMMHTIRLLDTAVEILEEGVLNVRRPNRTELLEIRKGVFSYDELIEMAEARMQRIETAWAHCTLPKEPDKTRIESLLIQTRRAFYRMYTPLQ